MDGGDVQVVERSEVDVASGEVFEVGDCGVCFCVEDGDVDVGVGRFGFSEGEGGPEVV